MSNRETKLLDALYWMYSQYCTGGHDFMGAGEDASEILEDAGYIVTDGVGRITKDNGFSYEQKTRKKLQPIDWNEASKLQDEINQDRWVCSECGADEIYVDMIGDPEYNDLWHCTKCDNDCAKIPKEERKPSTKPFKIPIRVKK